MARNAWKFVAVALLAVGAIATAAPLDSAASSQSQDGLETRPATPDQICTDATIGETLGGDPKGCREYLDACLDELTTSQREEWHRSVDACLDDHNTALFRCYAQVPWC